MLLNVSYNSRPGTLPIKGTTLLRFYPLFISSYSSYAYICMFHLVAFNIKKGRPLNSQFILKLFRIIEEK